MVDQLAVERVFGMDAQMDCNLAVVKATILLDAVKAEHWVDWKDGSVNWLVN